MSAAAWEEAAHDWARFARGDTDVLYAANASAFLDFLPPPGSLTVDVGCGEGRFDRLLAAAGHTVIGIDGSPTLVRLAQEAQPELDFRVGDAAALPLHDAAADVAVSFMALHDIADLAGTCREVRRVLTSAGRFCFAILHPVATGGDFDGPGADARFVLDRYFPAAQEARPLLESRVTQYHRPLGAYVEALGDAGFVVSRVGELPTQRRAAGRVPMFLHVEAVPAPRPG